MKKENVYFIALLPSSPVYDEAQKLKVHFAEQYESKAALKSPPHVTLHMPFWCKKKKENLLIEILGDFATEHSTPELVFDGFGTFPPCTIYIDIIKNKNLALIQKQLHITMKRSLYIFNANYRDKPFKPHLTIAFRDLKKSQFDSAWAVFSKKEFVTSCTVKELTLLKHNGQHWDIFKSFPFAQS